MPLGTTIVIWWWRNEQPIDTNFDLDSYFEDLFGDNYLSKEDSTDGISLLPKTNTPIRKKTK